MSGVGAVIIFYQAAGSAKLIFKTMVVPCFVFKKRHGNDTGKEFDQNNNSQSQLVFVNGQVLGMTNNVELYIETASPIIGTIAIDSDVYMPLKL